VTLANKRGHLPGLSSGIFGDCPSLLGIASFNLAISAGSREVNGRTAAFEETIEHNQDNPLSSATA
jgi:hypothetical protein